MWTLNDEGSNTSKRYKNSNVGPEENNGNLSYSLENYVFSAYIIHGLVPRLKVVMAGQSRVMWHKSEGAIR
jgi:hypothetical protein